MDINTDLKMAALEIADDLLEAIDQSEFKGVTMMQGAAALGLPYREFYQSVVRLEDLGKIKLVRDRRAGNRYRIVRPDAPCIDEATIFTPVQKRVFDYLCGRADERGLVHASLKQISEGIGHNSTCSGSIDALDRRGFLEILHRGDSKRPRLYKIFPNGDGPKGWSEIWFNQTKRPPPLYALLTKENDDVSTV